jgi:hypothetical protein
MRQNHADEPSGYELIGALWRSHLNPIWPISEIKGPRFGAQPAPVPIFASLLAATTGASAYVGLSTIGLLSGAERPKLANIFPRDRQSSRALAASQRAEINKRWPIIKAANINAE